METKPTEKKNVVVAKTPAELQKIRVDKLMRNPTKDVFIPDPSQERKPRDPLEFIRNVWGSSAGAGSGDFHVYRGVRRREYARQKYLDEKFERDNADEDYQRRLIENQKAAEERTAKKRAKRLKKKQKQNGKKPKKEKDPSDESDEDSEVEEEENEDKDVQKSGKGNNSVSDCVKGNNCVVDCDKGDNLKTDSENSVSNSDKDNHISVKEES